jgi:sialate O-acetylesterase
MKTFPALPSRSFRVINAVLASLAVAGPALAEVKTPAIFGSNMVLQRDHANPVWGWADKGEKVTVSIAGQAHKTQAGKDGAWRVTLQPLKATAKPLTLTIKGKNELKYDNVLVGEVWLCSGQSNMGMNLAGADDSDLEIMSAKHPNLRIISVPQVGTQEPQKNFDGQWEGITPDNAGNFSAVGYLFGRQIHQVLDVPVGLIDNAWGGSACEAWIRRDLLEKTAVAKPYVEQWKKTEAEYDPTKAMAEYEVRMAKWKEKAKKLRAEKKGIPRPPRKPRNPLTGQHRPANLYNGVLKPIIGYGIKGAIWYQGESNSARAKAYRTVFPLMIQNWRDEWKQGDFSFYWVQLADFRAENPEPEDDSWPELREAQTLTLDKLPNTGEAVIIDVGEGRDIHPRNKQIVARRLARLALAKDYGLKIPHASPRFKSLEIQDGKAIVSFDKTSGGLYSFDANEPKGFAICGEDKKFVWAEARIKGKSQVEVWAEGVKKPIAVRYAWANNPICTLYGRDGAVTLPVTPFRTDDFPMVTEGK